MCVCVCVRARKDIYIYIYMYICVYIYICMYSSEIIRACDHPTFSFLRNSPRGRRVALAAVPFKQAQSQYVSTVTAL